MDAISGAPLNYSNVRVIDADGSDYATTPHSSRTTPAGAYSITLDCRDSDAVVQASGAFADRYFTGYGLTGTDPDHAQKFSLRTGGVVTGQDVLLTPPGWFVPAQPRRLIDTRGDAAGPLGPRESRTFVLDGLPAETTAVVLNVTATQGTAPTSFVSVVDGPKSTPPTQSSLNSSLARDVANLVTVRITPPRASGRATPQVTLYNHAGTTHLVADLAGYFATSAGAGLVPVDAVRIVDTRESAPLAAGETRTVPLTPPPGTVAVAATVTSTQASAGTSYVSVFPAGAPDGRSVSTLNAYRGDDIANLAIVPLGADGAIALRNDQGSTHVVVDVVGWFVQGTGAAYFPIDPRRSGEPLGLGNAAFHVDGPDIEVSSSKVALVANLTMFGATVPTYVTAWGQGLSQPATSSANARPGADVGTAVLMKTNGNSGIMVTAGRNYVMGIVDVGGYFMIPGDRLPFE